MGPSFLLRFRQHHLLDGLTIHLLPYKHHLLHSHHYVLAWHRRGVRANC